MGIEEILGLLTDAGISTWLDAEGKLRIDKSAPPKLKDLVREHRQALIDVNKALLTMNSAGIRIIRLPLGHYALAYQLGTDLDQIRGAMRALQIDSMPLVINDEGLRWMTWEEWRLRRLKAVSPVALPRRRPMTSEPGDS